jgi:ribosomal protein S27AE
MAHGDTDYTRRLAFHGRIVAKELPRQIDEMVILLRGFYPPDPDDERASQAGRISPERAAVYQAVAVAIRRGELVRPETCSQCTAPGNIHAHHADYAKPLDVRWLCASCHRLHHTQQARAAFLATLAAEQD